MLVHNLTRDYMNGKKEKKVKSGTKRPKEMKPADRKTGMNVKYDTTESNTLG